MSDLPAPVPGSGHQASSPRVAFEYALLRAVPRVDRGEYVNIGVLLYSQDHDYLAARVHLDPDRIRTLDPDTDLDALRTAVDAITGTCAGDPDTGPAAALPTRQRFGWLTAPRSTVVQTGPVHSGLTADPGTELDRLVAALVH
ncbi:MAG: DUF3037 domain-containing protein [Kineosporiaceae bacterium]